MLTVHACTEMKINYIATQIECGFYSVAQGWPSSARKKAK